jgi:hypothetical protein
MYICMRMSPYVLKDITSSQTSQSQCQTISCFFYGLLEHYKEIIPHPSGTWYVTYGWRLGQRFHEELLQITTSTSTDYVNHWRQWTKSNVNQKCIQLNMWLSPVVKFLRSVRLIPDSGCDKHLSDELYAGSDLVYTTKQHSVHHILFAWYTILLSTDYYK